jgi:hypothetical protein
MSITQNRDAGMCEFVAEIFQLFACKGENVAIEGLRAIANLAIASNSNQSRFALRDVCEVIFDVIHHYYFLSKLENDLLALFISRAIFHLSQNHTTNKDRCIELNIPAELRSILRSRSITESTRIEIKNTINFLHY